MYVSRDELSSLPLRACTLYERIAILGKRKEQVPMSPDPDHVYAYDADTGRVILVDSETGEAVESQEDRLQKLIRWLGREGEEALLRRFCLWCAHRMSGGIKPVQQKLMLAAEEALGGNGPGPRLEKLYEETEGMAVATDTVGLRRGDRNAPALLATRECVNPDPLEGALQSARYLRLWKSMSRQSSPLPEGGESDDQPEVDYLLELIAGRR